MFERILSPARLAATGALLAFVFPCVAAAALNPPTITVSGQNLPVTDTIDNTLFAPDSGWSVVMTFGEALITPPTVVASDHATESFPQLVSLCDNQAASTTYCFTYTKPSTFHQGSLYYFDVSDAAGASGSMSLTSYRFILDTAAPVLAFTSVPNPSHSALPTIAGTSDDAQSPITVHVYSATQSVYMITSAPTGNWSVTVPAGSPLSAGSYTVEASSTDPYGHRATPITATLVVDNSAPAITFPYSPAASGYASSTTVVVPFVVSDPDNDSVAIQCWFNAGAPHPCAMPSETSQGTLAEGPNTFHITATDVYGNVTTTVRSFIVDVTPPVLSEVAPIGTTTNTSPAYQVVASEAASLAFGGSCATNTVSVPAGQSTIIFTNLSVGTYSNCTVIPTDLAGNRGLVLAVTPFTIVSTSPSQGLPQGLSTGTNTTSVQNASAQGKASVQTHVLNK